MDDLVKIAELLKSLPSDELRSFCRTPDQINEWLELKKNQQILADAWRSKWINPKSYDYPIAKSEDRGEISNIRAELLELRLNEYHLRWELCQVAFPLVKEAFFSLQYVMKFLIELLPSPADKLYTKLFGNFRLKIYPFRSAYDLFAETLKEDINGYFKICLQPYANMAVHKWQKATPLIIDNLREIEKNNNPLNLEPNFKNLQKFNDLVGPLVGFSWLGMTILVSCLLAHENPLLKEKFRNYCLHYQKLLLKTVSASRNSKVHSIQWTNGEMTLGSKIGGKYLKP